MTNEIPAPPGYFVSNAGSSAITPAPVGSFVPSAGQAFASSDAAGRYTPITGMSAAIVPGDVNNIGYVSQADLNAVLTNYWPNSPWVTLTNFAGLCNGQYEFTLTNATAWNFSVLVSSNLTGSTWTYLGVAHPMYQFVDPAATNGAPQRFYRLNWP
jgi:hypothetical protein